MTTHDDTTATTGPAMWTMRTNRAAGGTRADEALRDAVNARLSRRQMLRAAGVVGFGGMSVGALVSGASAATKTTKATRKATPTTVKRSTVRSTQTTTKAVTSAANCSVVPTETAGPFPGDGSNGANLLTQPGSVRSDIRSSIVTSTTTAKGVPLTIRLTVTDNAKGCTPSVGAAVYVWHCSSEGSYSMYSAGVTNENYLRGVQPTDASGTATFQSVYPAAYPGRWPHIHFEVYPSVAKATTSGNAIHTSQIALPEAENKLVYATSGYGASLSNLAATPLRSDFVFSDGYSRQLGTMTGNVTDGFVVSLTIGI